MPSSSTTVDVLHRRNQRSRCAATCADVSLSSVVRASFVRSIALKAHRSVCTQPFVVVIVSRWRSRTCPSVITSAIGAMV